jgi:hypothetical protein
MIFPIARSKCLYITFSRVPRKRSQRLCEYVEDKRSM